MSMKSQEFQKIVENKVYDQFSRDVLGVDKIIREKEAVVIPVAVKQKEVVEKPHVRELRYQIEMPNDDKYFAQMQNIFKEI